MNKKDLLVRAWFSGNIDTETVIKKAQEYLQSGAITPEEYQTVFDAVKG